MIVSATLDFELRSRIGATEGHNSEVYLAHDEQLDATIVVKKIPKSSFLSVAKYYAEAKRLYDARHPNVVTVKYACEDSGSVFLAMPHYARGSIGALLDQRRITNREIVRYGLDVLNGLHHVHTRGMAHFDVRPSNVLIDQSNRAALTDFGLSRHLRPDGLATADALYFRHWPPEYLMATDLSPAADVYQAGLTLYRMAVGVSALEEQVRGRNETELLSMLQKGTFPNRSAFPIHTPKRLRKVIRTALAVDPGNRFASVLEMLAALGRVDQWLDWQCFRDRTTDSWSWEVSRDGQLRTVTLDQNAGIWSVEGKKMNEKTLKVSRQSACSADGLAWGEARRLVEKALSGLE